PIEIPEARGSLRCRQVVFADREVWQIFNAPFPFGLLLVNPKAEGGACGSSESNQLFGAVSIVIEHGKGIKRFPIDVDRCARFIRGSKRLKIPSAKTSVPPHE